MSALGAVVLVVAFIVFSGSAAPTTHLIFDEAGQLVRGDQVLVGGVPVGSVTNIVLTHDFKAKVTIHIEGSLVPLHEGTVAQVQGALALERRQPLHRAAAGAQQQPGAARRLDAARDARPRKSSTSTSCSTR